MSATACDYGSIFIQKWGVFCIVGEEGSKEGILLAWFFPWKATPTISLPWQSARTHRTAWGWTLPFPAEQRICYSKCPLIYSRKLQRFQTQCPSLSSLANTRGFTVVLPVCCSRHCGSVWHPSDTTHNLYSQLGPFWEHVQALFQPSQDNISLLSVTWLPDCRQHFALVRFCESRTKNNSFYFSFSSLMC